MGRSDTGKDWINPQPHRFAGFFVRDYQVPALLRHQALSLRYLQQMPADALEVHPGLLLRLRRDGRLFSRSLRRTFALHVRAFYSLLPAKPMPALNVR